MISLSLTRLIRIALSLSSLYEWPTFCSSHVIASENNTGSGYGRINSFIFLIAQIADIFITTLTSDDISQRPAPLRFALSTRQMWARFRPCSFMTGSTFRPASESCWRARTELNSEMCCVVFARSHRLLASLRLGVYFCPALLDRLQGHGDRSKAFRPCVLATSVSLLSRGAAFSNHSSENRSESFITSPLKSYSCELSIDSNEAIRSSSLELVAFSAGHMACRCHKWCFLRGPAFHFRNYRLRFACERCGSAISLSLGFAGWQETRRTSLPENSDTVKRESGRDLKAMEDLDWVKWSLDHVNSASISQCRGSHVQNFFRCLYSKSYCLRVESLSWVAWKIRS